MFTRRDVAKTGVAAACAAGFAGGFSVRHAWADEAVPAGGDEAAAPVTVDVVVLGAGGAGLAAAATAAAAGASVAVLEAGSFAGGATIYSGGHMLWIDEQFNAAQERNDADLQKYLELDPAAYPACADDLALLTTQVEEYLADTERAGRFDSVERVMVDHYIAGSGTDVDGNPVHLDYAMIRAAADTCMDVFAWLQSGGMEIKDSLYKNHANSPVSGGSSLVEALVNLAEGAGARIAYETRATGLTMQGGVVTGVRALGPDGAKLIYQAKRVVIATGGYASNGALAALYQNYGTGLSASVGTTNPPTNRGEGMAMAQRSGAQVRDLQFLTTVLQGYHGGCSLSEAGNITGRQQLVVNAEGLRFVDESNSGNLQKAMNNQTDGLGFFIGDAAMLAAINEAKEGFAGELAERDWFFVADTLEDAATAAGLDPAVVRSTVDEFNAAVEEGDDPAFGRVEFNGAVAEGPFVVAKMEMHYHLTFGGLVVDENAQVLDCTGNPIPGLFAAGDVLSGYEGLVHQSGDCLSVVVHTGIVAGTLA